MPHIVRHQQDLKRLTHTAGRDQMFQLQRDLRPLLRQTAILKRIGKPRRFANPDQKLLLGNQRQPV